MRNWAKTAGCGSSTISASRWATLPRKSWAASTRANSARTTWRPRWAAARTTNTPSTCAPSTRTRRRATTPTRVACSRPRAAPAS
ncbi:Uncharacterised protein [Bordetella pertussis]|nr:Uncharacterised protein [Bordetella pertussis]